jgi:hypothetical protein
MTSTDGGSQPGPQDPAREPDTELLLSSWFTHVDSSWAVRTLEKMAAREPELFWQIAHKLVERSRGDGDLFALGAHPLQTLLASHGEAFLDRIVLEATNDPRWRTALIAVDLGGCTPEISSQLRRRLNIFVEGTE